MFSCCLQTTPGSDAKAKKGKSKDHGGAWRRKVRSCFRRLWPFARKKRDLTQCRKAKGYTGKGEHVCAPKDPKEPCRESRISADMVERLVNYLVPSLQGGDVFFVPAFLYTYRRFATTEQVLDLLFKKYACFRLYNEEDEQLKKTICTFLDTWMDKKPEEFCQSSCLPVLKKMKSYLIDNMPYSDLIVRVHMLLTYLEEQGAGSKDDDEGRHTSSDSELEAC